MAEWLTREIRNLFLSEGAGSNPAGVAGSRNQCSVFVDEVIVGSWHPGPWERRLLFSIVSEMVHRMRFSFFLPDIFGRSARVASIARIQLEYPP